jgi:DNA-binding response OmpR family regulator
MLRALVVDPDNVRGSAVVCDLSEEGFLATRVSGVQEVMAVLASSAPDVVLSEFDLGTSDAADLAKVARRMSDVPIVVLADERPPNQVIAALEAGVDKYLQRPCSPQELAARIRSLLRRTGASIDLARALIVGNLEVDPAAMTVRKDGAMVPLTRNELELLLVLARSRCCLYPRMSHRGDLGNLLRRERGTENNGEEVALQAGTRAIVS